MRNIVLLSAALLLAVPPAWSAPKTAAQTALVAAVQQFRVLASTIVSEREAAAFNVMDQSHQVTAGWSDVELLRVPGKATRTPAPQVVGRTLNGLTYTGNWLHQASPLNVRGGVVISGPGTSLELVSRVSNGSGTITMKGTLTVKGITYGLEMEKIVSHAKSGLPQVTSKIVVMQNQTRIYDKAITRSMDPTVAVGSRFVIGGAITAHGEKDATITATGTFTGLVRETLAGKVTYTAGKLTLNGSSQLAATLTPQTDGTLAGNITSNGAVIGTVVITGYTVKVTLGK